MVDELETPVLDQVGSWPSEWLRGLMELCVLRVIADGPTYGYAIAAVLERAGLGNPKGGTLYPLLGRLEQASWVRATWAAGDGGPGRKFYELTATGRDQFDRMRPVWSGFAAAVSRHLEEASMPGEDFFVATDPEGVHRV